MRAQKEIRIFISADCIENTYCHFHNFVNAMYCFEMTGIFVRNERRPSFAPLPNLYPKFSYRTLPTVAELVVSFKKSNRVLSFDADVEMKGKIRVTHNLLLLSLPEPCLRPSRPERSAAREPYS